jgi:hypothetical protein
MRLSLTHVQFGPNDHKHATGSYGHFKDERMEDVGFILPADFHWACLQVRPGLDSVSVEKAWLIGGPFYVARQGDKQWIAYGANALLEVLNDDEMADDVEEEAA